METILYLIVACAFVVAQFWAVKKFEFPDRWSDMDETEKTMIAVLILFLSFCWPVMVPIYIGAFVLIILAKILLKFIN